MSHITLNEYVFDRHQKIGRGSSGVVYLGYHQITRDKVAIKRVDIENLNEKMKLLWNEIQIMKEMKHENIVELYDVHIDIKNDYLYLIMEYCESDLSDFIHDYILDIDQIHHYMIQLRDGYQYLQNNNVVHRDLKPQNLLIKDGKIKIADFGLSTNTESHTDLMQTMCGSPLYMSPEIIERQKYTAKSDLWSIGIIMYQLIYHTHPFQKCKNFTELQQKIQNESIVYPDKPPLDSLTRDLLEGLLNKNCHNRISWKQFFQHPWFAHKPVNPDTLELSHTDMFYDDDSIISITSESEDSITDEINHSHQNDSMVNNSLSPHRKLNLSKYVVENYQKTRQQRSQPINCQSKYRAPALVSRKLYGTSAPEPRIAPVDYSSSAVDFNSMGSSFLNYVRQSYSWIRSTIDL